MIKIKSSLTVVIVLIIGFFLYAERFALMLVSEDSVNGTKFVSLSVDGDVFGNGYRFYSIRKPFWSIGKKTTWKFCDVAKPEFIRFISGITQNQLDLADEFQWVSEQGEKRTRIYIKAGKSLLYVHGFEDYGGKLSFSEEDVCFKMGL